MSPTLALLGFVALAVLVLRPILAASARMTPRQPREVRRPTPIEPDRIFRVTVSLSPDSPSPREHAEVAAGDERPDPTSQREP